MGGRGGLGAAIVAVEAREACQQVVSNLKFDALDCRSPENDLPCYAQRYRRTRGLHSAFRYLERP